MLKSIDARGLACPKPVILTKKELEAISEGTIRTIVDNEVAVENLKKLANSLNFEYEACELPEGSYAITIEKAKPNVENTINIEESNQNVIAIGSDKMGKGDKKLGKILMKSFIYTVGQTKPYPKAIIFYNSAVRLTCEESHVLDDLIEMSKNGVKIISCGTCLDYYELKESLRVGEISNMYTIYELMNNSKVINIG